jgi:hypothetical protein
MTKLKHVRKSPTKPVGKSPSRLSISALSVALGVDRRTIDKVLRELKVKPVGMVKGSPVFDRAEAEGAMKAHVEASAARLEPRARLTMAQAVLAEIKASILKRDHVPVAMVKEWGASLGADIRKIVTQLHLLAPSLSGLGVAEIDAALRRQEDEFLVQLHGLNRQTDDYQRGAVTKEEMESAE